MKSYAGLRGSRLSVAIGIVAGLCFFLTGYDQGDMGGFLTVTPFVNQFPQINSLAYPHRLHVSQLEEFTVAAWNLGCLLSALLTIFVGDYIGRKRIIYVGLTVLLLGEVIQCSSFTWGQFVAGRLVAGIGNGFNTAIVPAWQAECTKAHRRGTLLMISAGVCIAAGLSFSYWIDFAFAWLDGSATWRAPIALQIIFILAGLTLLGFLPESPRWLILQGREDEALDVLAALNDVDDRRAIDIRQEFVQIKDAVLEMSRARCAKLVTMGDYRDVHRVVLAVALQFGQQVGGINFVTQYFASMFVHQYAWDPWHARLLAACAGTLLFLTAFIPAFAIDRLCGRRTLMLIGTTGMLVSMVVLTVMVYLSSRVSLYVGTAFIFVYTSFFSIGWQGMAWIIPAEVVSLRVRGPANAISTASNWTANFIVVIMSAVAFENIGYRTYLIFVATNAVILPLVYFFLPETGMRCLEEIDYIFHTANSTPHPWLDVVKVAADEPLWYGDAFLTTDDHPRRLSSNDSFMVTAAANRDATPGYHEGSLMQQRRMEYAAMRSACPAAAPDSSSSTGATTLVDPANEQTGTAARAETDAAAAVLPPRELKDEADGPAAPSPHVPRSRPISTRSSVSRIFLGA